MEPIPDLTDLTERTDVQLVVLIARKEDGALAEVFRRHSRMLYGLARRVVGDGGEAEELTQEAVLYLWSHPEGFDAGRGTLRTYLSTYVHGRAVDVVRSRVARQCREGQQAWDALGAGDDLDREVWDLTVVDHVARAMSSLSAAERTTIELAYFDGLTYREVARRLSQPASTVKSRIRNGLRRLRADLVVDGARRR